MSEKDCAYTSQGSANCQEAEELRLARRRALGPRLDRLARQNQSGLYNPLIQELIEIIREVLETDN